jgi:hypothetical protein
MKVGDLCKFNESEIGFKLTNEYAIGVITSKEWLSMAGTWLYTIFFSEIEWTLYFREEEITIHNIVVGEKNA